jgi:hypothetical protein
VLVRTNANMHGGDLLAPLLYDVCSIIVAVYRRLKRLYFGVGFDAAKALVLGLTPNGIVGSGGPGVGQPWMMSLMKSRPSRTKR